MYLLMNGAWRGNAPSNGTLRLLQAWWHWLIRMVRGPKIQNKVVWRTLPDRTSFRISESKKMQDGYASSTVITFEFILRKSSFGLETFQSEVQLCRRWRDAWKQREQRGRSQFPVHAGQSGASR